MYVTEQDDSGYRVHYRSYRLGVLMLILPPLMLFEFGPGLIAGSLDASELAALTIGVLMPLLAAHLLIEFASFSFSVKENRFNWRWRKLLRPRSLEIPLQRIVHVRREKLESGNSAGPQYTYRLVVELDDETVIGLTRGYATVQARQLNTIVNQIRGYLGHIVPMR